MLLKTLKSGPKDNTQCRVAFILNTDHTHHTLVLKSSMPVLEVVCHCGAKHRREGEGNCIFIRRRKQLPLSYASSRWRQRLYIGEESLQASSRCM